MHRALICLALLAATTPALAQRPITYREALEASLEANPTLQRSEISRDQAKSTVVSSLGGFDPTYNLTGFYDQRTSQQFFGTAPVSFDNTSWSFTNGLSGTAHTGTSVDVSQSLTFNQFEVPFQLPNGQTQISSQQVYNGSLSASVTQQLLHGLSFKYNLENVTVSRRNLEVADLTFERSKQDTLAQAAQAYWNWVYQTNLAEIQNEAVSVAQEALRVGELKVDAGELAPVEKTRLQAALVQAQANAIDTENAAEQAANDLLLVMGEDPNQLALPATPAGEVPSYELDAEKAVKVAMEQNLGPGRVPDEPRDGRDPGEERRAQPTAHAVRDRGDRPNGAGSSGGIRGAELLRRAVPAVAEGQREPDGADPQPVRTGTSREHGADGRSATE